MINELDIVKDQNGVLGMVYHTHDDFAEVLFSDATEEQLSCMDYDTLTPVEEGTKEHQTFMEWYEGFNRRMAQ